MPKRKAPRPQSRLARCSPRGAGPDNPSVPAPQTLTASLHATSRAPEISQKKTWLSLNTGHDSILIARIDG